MIDITKLTEKELEYINAKYTSIEKYEMLKLKE